MTWLHMWWMKQCTNNLLDSYLYFTSSSSSSAMVRKSRADCTTCCTFTPKSLQVLVVPAFTVRRFINILVFPSIWFKFCWNDLVCKYHKWSSKILNAKINKLINSTVVLNFDTIYINNLSKHTFLQSKAKKNIDCPPLLLLVTG